MSPPTAASLFFPDASAKFNVHSRGDNASHGNDIASTNEYSGMAARIFSRSMC
jgi:hypothetical protein